MKRFSLGICLICLCLLFFPKSSFSQIVFRPVASLDNLQTSKDYIYIDFYTDWCGPCKRMENECFPDSTIGTFYNTNFLNIRVNAEEGFGKILAERFGVVSYPTNLFLSKDLTEVYRYTGYTGKTAFLQKAQNLVQRAEIYTAKEKMLNELTTDSLKLFILAHKDSGYNISPYIDHYLQQLRIEDLYNKPDLQLFLLCIARVNTENDLYARFIDNLNPILDNTSLRSVIIPDVGLNNRRKAFYTLIKPVDLKMQRAKENASIIDFESSVAQYRKMQTAIMGTDTIQTQRALWLKMLDFYLIEPTEIFEKHAYLLDSLISKNLKDETNFIQQYRQNVLDKQLQSASLDAAIKKLGNSDEILRVLTNPLNNRKDNYELYLKAYAKLGIQDERLDIIHKSVLQLQDECARIKELLDIKTLGIASPE